MHYIDLLNYLIDVQKIEKDELCELLAIPKKKLDSVLTGITPLKKKCLKNLSLYTSISLDAIRSGNFVLNIPQVEVAEGEEAPKIIKDAYVPEYIREANTNRLKAYCKQRYKNERQDISLLRALYIIYTTFSLITLIAVLFTFSLVNFLDCAKTFIVGLLPVIFSIIINRATYKLAKNGTQSEGKYFKFHAILHAIQLIIHAISIFAFDWATPVLGVFALIAILPIIYLIFVDNGPLFSKAKTAFYAFLTSCSLALYFTFTLFGEKLSLTEDVAYNGVIITIGFLAIVTTMGCLLANYVYFLKRNNIAKHFEPVSRKRALKENHIFKSVVAVILAIVIIIGTINILPIAALNVIVNGIVKTNTQAKVNYYDYDKDNVVFSNSDKCITLEYDNYSIKIPENLKKSEKIEAYSNSDNTLYISVTNMFYDYEDTFNDSLSELNLQIDIKEAIIEEYGFFPKTEYEYNKLIKEIQEKDSIILKKDLAVAVTMFKISDAVASFDSDIYFYQDSEIEFCIRKFSLKRKDGKIAYSYDVSGNAVGNYDKYFDFNVVTASNDKENDIAYKIINSIEMK